MKYRIVKFHMMDGKIKYAAQIKKYFIWKWSSYYTSYYKLKDNESVLLHTNIKDAEEILDKYISNNISKMEYISYPYNE